MTKKRVILCFFDYFYPAFKSGGPARSSLGLVEHLGDLYEIKIITRDRDRHDRVPMKGIHPNAWNSTKGINVFYLGINKYWRVYLAIINQSPHVYYFNSFFSLWFTILPMVIIALTKARKEIVVAPRGELSPGAFHLKHLKKRLFVRIFSRLYSRVTFHASSENEKQDILGILPSANIKVALNLRPKSEFINFSPKPCTKKPGIIRMVFLSRIDRKKNLIFTLEILKQCKSSIEFDIYGIVDDELYWSSCKAIIDELNKKSNLKVKYAGEVSAQHSVDVISGYDLMIFNSLGENFAHSVLESFMAARPALISNTTYWRNLVASNAGWDFSLDSPELFVAKIDEIAELDRIEYQLFCQGAYQLATNYFNAPTHLTDYRALFG